MTFEQELMRARSAYFLDGWLKFNEEMWGYKAERVMYTLPGKERPALEGVLYLTKSGKVRMPPCNAYLPLQFYPTPTEKNCQLYTQWMSVAKLLAEDIKKRGIAGNISFPPGFTDGRWFQWLGFDVTFKYTFVTPLPYNQDAVGTEVRTHIRKSEKHDYIVECNPSMADVVFCLNQSATFKKFDKVSKKFLDISKWYLGENLYTHLAKTPKGQPVAVQVNFGVANGICIGWMAGIDRHYISDGVNQFLISAALQDICSNDSSFFDFCGADIEYVARAKAAWGFPLVPQIMLMDKSIRNTLKKTIAQIQGARTLYHKMRALTRVGSRHEQ